MGKYMMIEGNLIANTELGNNNYGIQILAIYKY